VAASGAYYNEIDPFAAAWLRQLMAEGLIAAGEVDERSIEDVYPDDLKGFVQCHFFAGIGVWSLALRMAGWPDDREIWTGSCPCQPFSAAGKGGGFDDERHLWPAFHWLIEKRRPVTVLGEQVASADGLHWLDLVSSDLEGSGYAFGALDTCAAGFSAPHIRQRFYWLGHSVGAGLEGYGGDQAARGRNGAKRSAPAPSIPVRLADAMSARRAEWRSGARFGSPAGVCGAGGMDVAVGFGWEPGRGDNAQYDGIVLSPASASGGVAVSDGGGSTSRGLYAGSGQSGSSAPVDDGDCKDGGAALHPLNYWADADWLLCAERVTLSTSRKRKASSKPSGK